MSLKIYHLSFSYDQTFSHDGESSCQESAFVTLAFGSFGQSSVTFIKFGFVRQSTTIISAKDPYLRTSCYPNTTRLNCFASKLCYQISMFLMQVDRRNGDQVNVKHYSLMRFFSGLFLISANKPLLLIMSET